MNKARIETLADGVFAIVMTLLAFEIKVPTLSKYTEAGLWYALVGLAPLFIGYFVGFAVLTSYWISHHFIIGVFAHNTDRKLTHLNIPFLAFVALIPFTSQLIGTYPASQLALILYALNVTIIGLILIIIRDYVYRSNNIKNGELIPLEVRHSFIHVILPPIFAILAVIVSFINTKIALSLFAFPFILNLIPGSISFIDRLIKKFVKNFGD